MTVSSEAHDLESFFNRYVSALNDLRMLGLRVDNGRLLTYRRRLESALAQELRSPELQFEHQREHRFLNTLLEATEIISIAGLDPSLLCNHDVLTKLRKLGSGPEILDPKKDDPARNYAFEFSAAALASAHGKLVGFMAGDLEVGPPPCPIECKRISSLKRLRSNLADARDQLVAGGRPGLIAIDLSAPIRHEQGIVVHCESESAQRLRVDQELEAYLGRHLDEETIRAAIDPTVLGVVFRHVIVGSVGPQHQIRTSRTWQVLTIHENEALDEQFISSLGWLGDTPLVPGTAEELRAAQQAIFTEP